MKQLWTHPFFLVCLSALSFFLSFQVWGKGHRHFLIYSIQTSLPMHRGEKLVRDFYVNMGSQHGVQKGSLFKVYRRMSTYDLLQQTFYYETVFPIGEIKVIHVEPFLSIARLHKLYPSSQTPLFSPKSIAVGDLVQLLK